MATSYPCTDDPNEVIEGIVQAQTDAEKFDQFVNGGVLDEVQLGEGQPTPTLRNVVHLVKSAAATLDGADVSGKSADAANGGTTLRMLSERFGDLVNVKDFGAIGDGSANDTAAWTAWQTALASGGIGYVPSGSYKVNGVVKRFPSGCIGQFGDGFSAIKPGFTDRFSNAIPVGQGHVISNSRTITVSSGADGTQIYPTISIDAKIDVPSTASAVDLDGNLIASCHGIFLQHILTGGNEDNKLSTTCLVTNAINDALGDNDCSGVAARAQKTANAGVGDTAGLGGRVDNYSTQCGGVMGAEVVCYNYAQGVPCPSDFSNVSTSRWATPLHVIGNTKRTAGGTTYFGSPMTAAILMQGSRTSPAFWDGLQFSFSMFPSIAVGSGETAPSSVTKNLIPCSSDSRYHTAESVSYETYPWTKVIRDEDGSETTRSVTMYRVPDTVAINMGSFSQSGGYPDTCIKMGMAKQHIWTPNRELVVRAHGINVRGGGAVSIKANSQVYIPDNSSTPIHSNAGLNFCETSLDGSTETTNASFYFNAETYSVALHNFASNMGLVFYKPDLSFSADDVAYFMPGMCTVLDENQNPVLDGSGNPQEVVSKINLGSGYRRWENVYAVTSAFGSSDERIKQDVADIPEAVLRAWGRVKFRQFKFKEAVAQKGNSARLHVGVIAQRVIEAFEAEGVDAFAYGLIGHDVQAAREAVYRDYDVQHEAEHAEDGTIMQEAWTEHRHELVSEAEPACDIYSIRYEEALALECAYQRWRLDQIEARLGAVEQSA